MISWWIAVSALAGPPGFDHAYAEYDAFLEGAVHGLKVDYGLLAQRRAPLDATLALVASAPVADFSKSEKVALYTNAYNAYTLSIILDEPSIGSIMELDGGKVWDTRKFLVGGASLTLNDIEHKRLRPLADGRVHALVNCASMGCPPLPPDPVVPGGLDAQLSAGAQRWVQTNAYTLVGGKLQISSIFDWYAEDFSADGSIAGVNGKEAGGALFLKTHGLDASVVAKVESGELQVTWQPYDWALNRR